MHRAAATLHKQALPTPYATSQQFHIQEVDLDGPGEGEVRLATRSHLQVAQSLGALHSEMLAAAFEQGNFGRECGSCRHTEITAARNRNWRECVVHLI
jgi:hypothetical protein